MSDAHYLAISSFLKLTDHKSREALMIIRLRHYGDQTVGPGLLPLKQLSESLAF